MTLRNKNILLISPEPWDHIFVSKHHYAIHLARRGNSVFFVNPPKKNFAQSGTDFGGVFSLDYEGFRPGLRFFPAFLRRWFIKRKFETLQRKVEVKFDVIWNFDTSVFFDLHTIPPHILKICHIVDANQDFQTAQLASSSDYCFCTTEVIKKRLLKFNSHVHKIQHGYNVTKKLDTIQLPGIGKIKAIYSGNLSIPYIDWDLLLATIQSQPLVDFVFIGPNKSDFRINTNQMHDSKKKIMKMSNVFSMGKIDANQLPSYLMAADVLLIAYQEKYQQDQVANPHKVTEYLGAGKAIVATYTAEFALTQDLIVMSSSNQDYIKIFDSVLTNLEYYNSEELIEKRQSYAMDNSYENQIKKIEKIIYGA